MKIIHIFKNTNKKFYEPYIKFINKNFNKEEHYFIIEKYIIDLIEEKYDKNMEYIEGIEYISLIKNMKECDKIILHGLFSPILVFILYTQPSLLKKCYWVVWGGDLYYSNNRKRNIKSDFYEHLRKSIIKKFKAIITLVEDDYKIVHKTYNNVKGKHFIGRYINPINFELIDSLNRYDKVDNSVINIQVGNSADSSNNHMEVLDILKNYKDENIKIFVPLSYGDERYASKVEQYGKKIFGDKFISMTEFLSPEKYLEFLNSIDIALFANNRQQALGNIFILIYLGKKVYIRNDISTWKYLNDKLDIEISNYLDIPKLSFKELCNIKETTIQKNRKNVSELLDNKEIKSIWNTIFID